MKNKLPILALFAVALTSAAYGQKPPAKTPAACFDSFPDLASLQAAPKPAGPDWMHNAVFYQIYPQTFCDSDGDGIGDIKGIISKLDYVKNLGVDAIWINPFFESPFHDAGYDISDYYKVAPRYGTNEDMKALFKAAHEKGLRVLFDFVASYTSIDHPWFKASCDPKPNKYSNWYVWTDDTWFAGQENYTALFVQGYCERNGNFLQNFFWNEPALNYGYAEPDPQQKWQLPVDHPDVLALRKEMINIVRFWMDMGADGFRADMASTLVKNDPDERKTCEVWQEIRAMLDKDFPQAFTVAEWEDSKAADAGFNSNFLHWRPQFYDLWFRDKDSYFLPAGKGDITNFLGLYMQQRANSVGKDYICLTVGNHDLPRVNRWGRDRTDLELIQVFAFTMPNVPFLYYGDEIGMRQLPIQSGKEGCYGTRAGDRTPMQWSKGPNLGFSSGTPDRLWMPVDDAPDAPTVAAEEADPASMLHFVRTLVAFRKAHPALAANGGFYPVYAEPHAYPFIFIRASGSEKLLVIINPSADESTAGIKGVLNAKHTLLMGTNAKWAAKDGKTTIAAPGKSFSIYRIE
jgi:glycosidase